MRVGIVTGTKTVSLMGKSPMGTFVPDDDLLLTEALARRGIASERPCWDDPKVDWSTFDCCVIRSVWNYVDVWRQFLQWAESVTRISPLWNPVDMLHWNMDKSYLRQLEAGGVPIVPSEWFDPTRGDSVEQLVSRRGWETVIVKPIIGNMGAGVRKLSRAALASDRNLGSEPFIIQNYLSSVETAGELSLVFLNGGFSHAVQKVPPQGSYSIHGWRRENGRLTYHLNARPVDAGEPELSIAKKALAVMNLEYLFARVDLLRDEGGALVLSEIEVIAPALYLQLAPGGAELLAAGIAGAVDEPIRTRLSR